MGLKKKTKKKKRKKKALSNMPNKFTTENLQSLFHIGEGSGYRILLDFSP